MSVPFEIFPDITHVSRHYSGILLDAYGVFWNGNECGLIPASKEMMKTLVSSGKIVGILSNSTQLAAKEASKLKLHGLKTGEHFHFLLTSGDVARTIFLNGMLPFMTPKKTFFLFGGIHPKFSSHEAIFQDTLYSETPLVDDADFIYISIPHIDGKDQENPDVFREEIEKLKEKNLPMICPNPDQFAHEGKPAKAVVRQGSIAKMYENMGGQVFYIGKPQNNAYAFAMDHFERYHITKPNEILMVGDTPETDTLGANRFGMSSALVTETGIMADRIRDLGLQKAIEALKNQNCPNYFIRKFA